jgi:hypothetical protein
VLRVPVRPYRTVSSWLRLQTEQLWKNLNGSRDAPVPKRYILFKEIFKFIVPLLFIVCWYSLFLNIQTLPTGSYACEERRKRPNAQTVWCNKVLDPTHKAKWKT